MKLKKNLPPKAFILILLPIIFTSWMIYKNFHVTEKNQDVNNHANTERQRLKLAEEFDKITPEERKKLPKFDSRKYVLIKRNAHFWLIPEKYYGDDGFNIIWPDTVNDLLKKEWKNEFGDRNFFKVYMNSPQYYNYTIDYNGREIYSNTPCKPNPYRGNFKWNGVLIRIYNAHHIDIPDEQYLDVCLTSLKILNEKIIRLTLNDFQHPNTESY